MKGIAAPVARNDMGYSPTDMMLIIRVQALIRGFLDRRRFAAFKREIAQNNGNYFSKEEQLETSKG